MICASGEAAGAAASEATALVVRDYAQAFETPGGRRRKGAAPYVSLPTRHDGKRFRRVAKLERGAEVYAAWCLILAVAARCPRRGVLMDERGEPLTAEDLSDMTGFPRELFELGIAALLDERIGWLERVPLSVIEEAARKDAEAAASAVAGATLAGDGDAASDPASLRGSDGLLSVESTPAPPANPINSLRMSQDRPPANSPAISSPRPPSEEAMRIAAVEQTLVELGLQNEVLPDLYFHKPHVTPQLVRYIWNKVSRELRMKDPVPALIQMLVSCEGEKRGQTPS